MKKRGNILVENVIFIVLNLSFIAILVLFLSLKMSNSAVLEEVYAKQIALMIDSAKPGMIISFNMKEGIDKAKKELGEENIEDVVKIQGNIVRVSLRKGKSYSYSFFNHVNATPNLDTRNNEEFFFVVTELEPLKTENALLRIINYAKDNSVKNRNCNCGDECENYADFISQSASENGIEPILLLSLMMQESACRKNAESGSSVGLMQINLATNCGTRGLNLSQEECKNQLLNEAELNIDVGAKILKEKYGIYKDGQEFVGCTKTKTYSGWEAALRGYNGWGCDANYPAQDEFVEEIIARYEELKTK